MFYVENRFHLNYGAGLSWGQRQLRCHVDEKK